MSPRLPDPPRGENFRELIPLKTLREIKDIVRETLEELGWTCSWIDNTDEAVAETLKEHDKRVESYNMGRADASHVEPHA